MSEALAKAVRADLEKFNRTFEELGAVVTYDDGFVGIDSAKVPAAMLAAYNMIQQNGFASGVL